MMACGIGVCVRKSEERLGALHKRLLETLASARLLHEVLSSVTRQARYSEERKRLIKIIQTKHELCFVPQLLFERPHDEDTCTHHIACTEAECFGKPVFCPFMSTVFFVSGVP